MPWDWLLRWKLKLWRRRVKNPDYPAEIEIFKNYLESGSIGFELSKMAKPEKAGSAPPRVLGAPFLLRLHHWLMGEPMRLNEVQAWNYPMGLAKQRMACQWEHEGYIEIYNEHEAAFDRFVAEQERLALESASEKGGK